MAYKFETTEQNNATAIEYETKALLYLMSDRQDSKKIDNYVIDCFNDVSGCNANYDEIWDVQSKGIKTLRPKTIGNALYTLYNNSLHSFPFKHFILIMPKLKDYYFVNNSKKIFDINNFRKQYIPKIYEGLIGEYEKRRDIVLQSSAIEDFINKLTFVIADKSKVEYIRNLIKFRSPQIDDYYFNEIFKEISNKQTICKNISVHDVEIKKPSEVERYKKVIKRKEIYTLIVNRFLGPCVFSSRHSIPLDFYDEIRQFDEEERKNVIQDVNSEFAKLLFDKNNKTNFWKFFEKIVIITMQNHTLCINEIFNKLNLSELTKLVDVQTITIKYLIALIKDGLNNEN